MERSSPENQLGLFCYSLVAVWNGCCCSLQVTICSSVSGKSDESGNTLVMFSKNLYLARTVFLSLVLVRSLSHTDVPWQPRITEGEQRKRWRRWRKQKWDRQIVRYRNRGWRRMSELCRRLYTSAFWSFWLWSVSLMAGWSDTTGTEKRSSHNDAQHFMNQCVKKWGKDPENERKKAGYIYVLII